MPRTAKCKHPTVRLWRCLPFDIKLSYHGGLHEPLVPGNSNTRTGGHWVEVYLEKHATHKVCAHCAAQLSWGPALDCEFPKTVSGHDHAYDEGFESRVAIETVAAEIMGGAFDGVFTDHHLEGWKAYWTDRDARGFELSLTFEVGWLCAAIADELENDLSELDDTHTVARVRAGCSKCGAPKGAFCRTEHSFPCVARLYDALRATNRKACSLRGTVRHIEELLIDAQGAVDGLPRTQTAIEIERLTTNAHEIAQSALAPSRHHVP